MKLVFAIINSDDECKLLEVLNKNNFRTTRLCSSGGFLRAGNITLMSAVEDQRVDGLVSLIDECCVSRTQSYVPEIGIIHDQENIGDKVPDEAGDTVPAAKGLEVLVGGAIVFVLNVERFLKM